MATLIEEKYLETTTVLSAEETRNLDAILEAEPEPPTEGMVAAFAMAHQIKQVC